MSARCAKSTIQVPLHKFHRRLSKNASFPRLPPSLSQVNDTYQIMALSFLMPLKEIFYSFAVCLFSAAEECDLTYALTWSFWLLCWTYTWRGHMTSRESTSCNHPGGSFGGLNQMVRFGIFLKAELTKLPGGLNVGVREKAKSRVTPKFQERWRCH